MNTPQLALPIEEKDFGEVRVYRITLPYLPPSKNKINGWPREWRRNVKRKWVRDITQWCWALQIPQQNHRIGLAATLVFPTKNRRDPQNYSQELWNYVPDALQECGVLVDDREGAIQFGPNLGVRFAYDLRNRPKQYRQRTVLSISVRVPRRKDEDG